MSDHVERANLRSIDFTRLENDLAETAKQQPAPKPKQKPSGEIVLTQFEATAQAVLSMGDVMRERISKLDAGLADCYSVLKLIEDASIQIREQGTHVQLLIEEAAITSSEMREGVNEILKKIIKR